MSGSGEVQILDEGRALALNLQDGRNLRFHAVWLRDNALDEETRAAGNGQRLITLADIPEDTRVIEARLGDSNLEIGFGPDQKKTRFPLSWLLANSYESFGPREPGWLDARIETWDGTGNLLRCRFDEVVGSPEGLRRWLGGLRRHGIALTTEGPREGGALLRLVERFGFVRETNYGKWFEVRSETAPSNLAYTGLGLQAHTDNPYRDPVPTLQILYCLEDAAEGGESYVVDGFRAAQRLRDEAPEDFDLLTRFCARFAYAGTSNVRLSARRPMIELAPDGELAAVRFNNRSAAPLRDVPYDLVPDYYRAYRRFATILDAPDMAVEFKLAPGEAFVVDNTRVLHGRRGFTSGGRRWLQGCYADKDGALSTLAVLEEGMQA